MKKSIRRCVKIADCYFNMAKEARRKGEYFNAINYNIKAHRFYNIVNLFYSKLTLVFVIITAILQAISLIKTILT